MKFIYIFLLFLACFKSPLCAADEPPKAEESNKSETDKPATEKKAMSGELLRTIDYILNCFGNNQESTNKLIPVSKIVQSDCKINKLGMIFDFFGTLKIPAARNLAIQTVTELLQTVNSSSALKPYLNNDSFTENDIIIRIRIRPETCGFYYPPLGNVALISAMDGNIVYDTLNSYTYDLNNLMTESYQEALKLNAIQEVAKGNL